MYPHVFTLFSRIIPRWKITEGTKNDRIAENGLLRKNEREEEPSNGLTRRGKRERERGEISSNGERGRKAADEGGGGTW